MRDIGMKSKYMERVVITGMGAITPVGNDVPSFWESLKTGKCGIDLSPSLMYPILR